MGSQNLINLKTLLIKKNFLLENDKNKENICKKATDLKEEKEDIWKRFQFCLKCGDVDGHTFRTCIK